MYAVCQYSKLQLTSLSSSAPIPAPVRLLHGVLSADAQNDAHAQSMPEQHCACVRVCAPNAQRRGLTVSHTIWRFFGDVKIVCDTSSSCCLGKRALLVETNSARFAADDLPKPTAHHQRVLCRKCRLGRLLATFWRVSASVVRP